jgi:hypothetical protein
MTVQQQHRRTVAGVTDEQRCIADVDLRGGEPLEHGSSMPAAGQRRISDGRAGAAPGAAVS